MSVTTLTNSVNTSVLSTNNRIICLFASRIADLKRLKNTLLMLIFHSKNEQNKILPCSRDLYLCCLLFNLLYILVSTTCEILTGLIFLDYVRVRVRVMVFNATFNNMSVLLVEETGVPEENHWPTASH